MHFDSPASGYVQEAGYLKHSNGHTGSIKVQ